MKASVSVLLLLITTWGSSILAFAPVVVSTTRRKADTMNHHRMVRPTTSQYIRSQRPPTSLNLLLDVPDNFFAVTFFGMGIWLQISKNFARVRMEERAWEQRLEEARLERLRQDPTVTEIDLRRKEAAVEWSAYGTPRLQEAERASRRTNRVQVMDRTEAQQQPSRSSSSGATTMTPEEIEAFEVEFGVEYDPYYDDPYTEEDLPEGKFSIDKQYGDRVYDNGEIFYKDSKTGLFYRQGCKPRNLSFWG